MEALIVYRFNDSGKFVEPVELLPDEEGNFDIPEDCTEKELPQPNWKPLFDKEKNEWVETITPEELEELTKPPTIPLSDTEILGQQMTERESEAMVQGQQITDLEISSMFQGQFMTDYELRLLELEDKSNVIV
ncbi:hypothetical protein [Heyndrickxia sporothermodurans]|uniref:hypothetical protein n=1 Tax=Heyndrickxia sporothermodurans TaxID=46224 RepID=UPI0008257379|nr:hypothetical protein [Heyndrickxia sporothermodurans]